MNEHFIILTRVACLDVVHASIKQLSIAIGFCSGSPAFKPAVDPLSNQRFTLPAAHPLAPQRCTHVCHCVSHDQYYTYPSCMPIAVCLSIAGGAPQQARVFPPLASWRSASPSWRAAAPPHHHGNRADRAHGRARAHGARHGAHSRSHDLRVSVSPVVAM